jgi:GntR family transcriptional regulator, transcriptional repressor for pyruvate dehydrogenase complex
MAAALFSPVSTGRVSVEIVDRIKAAIRAGALAPGDQLPSERELTKQLGVSRVSVRDALRMLEANGLIEVRVGAKGGAFVTAPAPKLVGEGIADMLMLAADVDPAQITEARMVLELGMLEFHARLARCTQNVALALFAESFQAPLAASLRRARAADPHAGRAGALEHRDLVTAIAARDATRAREIMAAHIGRTAARVGVGS